MNEPGRGAGFTSEGLETRPHPKSQSYLDNFAHFIPAMIRRYLLDIELAYSFGGIKNLFLLHKRRKLAIRNVGQEYPGDQTRGFIRTKCNLSIPLPFPFGPLPSIHSLLPILWSMD